MQTSLKNIAEKLNLSKTTVSWVLSGKAREKGISQATADRVLEYAAELHYRPNLLARSLNTGETRTIGLIMPSIADSFYSEVARAIESEARCNGYSLMISSSEADVNREEEMIRLFLSKCVDGIIIAPTKYSKAEIVRLIDGCYPFVTFDRYFPELDASYVIINNRDSSYMLTQHLIKKGCKRIALLTTNSYLTTMSLRQQGYKEALIDSGFACKPDLIGEIGYQEYERNTYKVLDDIFLKVPDVDGFFFTTHILAIEAFQYFHDKGINTAFEMACIHEMPVFSVLAPKINVAKMPVEEIGRNSVKILMEQINHLKNNKGEKVPFHRKEMILSCPLFFRS